MNVSHINSKSFTHPAFDANALEDAQPISSYLHPLILGIVAGMRSMLPFALLNWSREPRALESTEAVTVLDSPGIRFLATSAALGEIVGDKLPFTPSRLMRVSLIGRLTIGAIAGAVLSRRQQQSMVLGALLGLAGAALGSYGGYFARISLAAMVEAPEILWGLSEDALALSLGYLAIKE